MVFVVHKDPSNQIAHIVVAVVLHRICQEIVDVNDATEGAVVILLDVGQFHHLVVAVEFKGVAVQHKEQDVTAKLQGETPFLFAAVEYFNFGKYKGRTVVDVLHLDPGYYSWMMGGDFTNNTKQVLTRIRLREAMK